MRSQAIGVWRVAVSAAGFATLPVFIKFAYAAGASLVSILAFRFLIATVLLFVFLKMRGISPAIDKRVIGKVCLLGAFGYGTMSSLFAVAVACLPASLAEMLLYTYPAMVCLLSALVGDEQLNNRKLITLVICFVGLAVVLNSSFTGVHLMGVAAGLGASLVYSCYILLSNRILKQVSPLVTTAYVCFSASIVFTAWGIATNSLSLALPLEGWLSIFGIAVFATCIAILLFFDGMSIVGASTAAIVSCIEPVVTIFLSVICLGERFTASQAGGGICILVAIIFLQLPGGEKAMAKKDPRC